MVDKTETTSGAGLGEERPQFGGDVRSAPAPPAPPIPDCEWEAAKSRLDEDLANYRSFVSEEQKRQELSERNERKRNRDQKVRSMFRSLPDVGSMVTLLDASSRGVVKDHHLAVMESSDSWPVFSKVQDSCGPLYSKVQTLQGSKSSSRSAYERAYYEFLFCVANTTCPGRMREYLDCAQAQGFGPNHGECKALRDRVGVCSAAVTSNLLANAVGPELLNKR